MPDTAPPPPSIAVVHLALKSYGLAPFERFVASYRAHPAGVAHRLVIALKGFTDLADAQPFLDRLDGIPHVPMLVADRGLDIGTYGDLARTLTAEYLCFLNSRAVILADDWLGKLFAAAIRPGVGASGATASYQGFASVMPARPGKPVWRGLRQLKAWLLYPYRIRHYPRFPNPHLRTNAFLIARALFVSLDLPPVRDKADAMRFESGWNGLTRQILRRGLRPLLVDRHGGVHEVEAWPATRIFWRGDQEDLLVADNQTDLYAGSDPATRGWHAGLAWGRSD